MTPAATSRLLPHFESLGGCRRGFFRWRTVASMT